MHVIVLGAGVVGVTTAYYLANQGCRVTVLERAGDVACETSFANAGQLSYSFTESLATPDFLSKLPSLIRGRDIGTRLKLSPQLVTWGSRFVSNCTAKRSRANSEALLDIAMQSQHLLGELRQSVPLEFSFRPAGKLVLLSSDAEVQSAKMTTAWKQERGCDIELVSASEAASIEPALASFNQPIKAAIYSRSDEVADAKKFVVGLREHLEQTYNVEFRLRTSVERLLRSNGRVYGVATDDQITADAVIVCLGVWSHDLLKTVNVNPHIYPVRGYSVTLPTGQTAPKVSLTCLSDRFVFSRLDDKIRLAGFADFNGFNRHADEDRIGTLIEAARRVAPEAAEYDDEQQHWGGFRPMRPSGRPYVGSTGVEGLYLNAGHGMLGWTLACASGKSTADAVLAAH